MAELYVHTFRLPADLYVNNKLVAANEINDSKHCNGDIIMKIRVSANF